MLAAVESAGRCGRTGLIRAFQTDLPVRVCPATDPETPSSGVPDALHQQPGPVRSAGATSHRISGYEAAEIMVRYRHLRKVVFLHLNRSRGLQDCFYDLSVAPLARLHPEHFVFSPFGILHVSPRSSSEVQELGVWHREAVLCRALRKIPFYRDFLRRRAFRRWQHNMQGIRFIRRRALLSRRMLTSAPHYTAALHHINRLLQQMAQLSWLPALLSDPTCLPQLETEQSQTRSEAKSRLRSLLCLTAEVLEMVRQDTYIMLQTAQEDAVHYRTEATRGRLQRIESWLHRLGSLSSLVGYMICENLTSILQRSVSTFVLGVSQVMAATERSFLLVSLEFGEDGDLRLSPPACQIQRSVTWMLEAMLDSVLEVTSASDQDRSAVSSVTHPPEHDGFPLHPVLGGTHLRQVVLAPALPTGKYKEMPMPGGRRTEGQQQRAHYLPLNLQPLHCMLHSDCIIQKAREQLQRLLQDSLVDVLALCGELVWLSDIHRYVQSWTPHNLKMLRGSSARDYEDLILKLQQWEHQVCGLKDCRSTAMLEVSCELIRTQTGRGLGCMLRDVLTLLTSEVANNSQSLICELSQALEVFRGVSTEISSFAMCTHKVVEYQMKKHELEEQVEHIRSLHGVLCMNYRQQTVEEQKVSCKLTDTWDLFQHFLKTSAEFLSSHLSSVSGSLEQSFEACYIKAEDLIAASSSTDYHDPDQNIALILRDLETLHDKLYSALSQLRDFSHSRQVLQGKSFDFSAISVGERQLRLRQESWKLLSRCSEQIAAWKRGPFIKVNIEWMREKLRQWERSLQNLMLPDEDPILQRVRGCLQGFSQHLPLFHTLLDPAVKQKHWAAIFAVLGKAFVEPKTLTLIELLSCPLLQEQENIQKILFQAQAEYSILLDFGKIQTFWQEKDLRLVRFFLCLSREDPPPDPCRRPPSGKFRECAKGHSTQDTGTYLLADMHALCSLIDDSLLSLQTIRSSPFSAGQRFEISGWIRKLMSLGQVLNLWVTFQRRWVFLTKVQYEMGISLPRLEMVSEFQSIDQSYRSFLEVTVHDPLVLSILNPARRREWHFYGDSLCSTLQRGISVLENITASLGDVLYASRCDFPRLFFLADQDMIDVLAASPDPSDRLLCALLCFPHFADVLFKTHSPESSVFPLISHHVTVGVIGTYGEALELHTPISWSPGTISWLIKLELRVQESLKNELAVCLTEGQQCCPHQSIHHEDLQRWVQHGMSYPLQCLIVTEEVVWCEGVEKLILTHQRTRLADWHKTKIEILVQKLREVDRMSLESSASVHQDWAFLSAWISLAVLQRDRTLSLLDSGIQSLDSFSWAKLMKYRAPTKSTIYPTNRSVPEEDSETQQANSMEASLPLCVVDVLGHLLPYKYEYVGLDLKIMDSSVSERTSLGLILALECFQCGALIGQDEGLRIQTLLALGSALGRQVVMLKCWAGLNVSRLTLHLQGALCGGAWLVLDNVHRLNSNVLASVGQLLSDIQASFIALMKKGESNGCIDKRAEIIGNIQLEERLLPVMRSYGCFVTLPHMDSSTSLPSNVHLLLRPVSFCPPDLQNIAELSLLSAGFQEHLLLAKKLSSFLRLAQESGAVPAASVLPLLKSIIQKAIVLFRSPHQCQAPHNMQCDCTTMTSSLQEETSLVTALLASSLGSSLALADGGHLIELLRSMFAVTGPPLPCSQTFAVLSHALQLHLHESCLEGHKELDNNIMWLYQAIQHGSGILLMGPVGGGKTTCWKALQQALNHMAANKVGTNHDAISPSYQSVHSFHLFPNSLSPTELLGGETESNGMFSNIFNRTVQESAAQKWIILDGSAALKWVEPISCLFGPQPKLTLVSGQQLHLTNRIKLLFEMPDTSALSPVVSTLCSLVYCAGQETWRTILKASLSSMYIRCHLTESTCHKLQTLAEHLIPDTLSFLEEHCASTLHSHPAEPPHRAHGVHQVSSFCWILQALIDQHFLCVNSRQVPERAEDVEDKKKPQATTQGSEEASMPPHKDQGVLSDNYQRAQTLFLYAFIWAFGGPLHPRCRSEFDGFLRKSLAPCVLQIGIPQDTSVFEVIPAPDGLTLTASPGAGQPQSEGLLYAARCILLSGHPVLLVGAPGSGKTTLAQALVPPGASSIRIPVNSMLQAAYLRQLLKTRHEAPPTVKQTTVQAPYGRQLFFLDDLHEAWADPESGVQPALEVVRHVVSEGGHGPQYSFLATASSPEDGYRSLCPRLSRLFCVLVMTPSDRLPSLFSPRFMVWLKKSIPFQQPKEFSEALAVASVSLYHQVIKAFPLKYCFSLHHLHRMLQSITFLWPSSEANLQVMPDASISAADLTQCDIVQIWSHEALRTFGDGLETHEENEMFREILRGCVRRTFSSHHTSENTTSADTTRMMEPLSSNEDAKLQRQLQPNSTSMEADKIMNEGVKTEADITSCDPSPSPRKFFLPAALLAGDDSLQDLCILHEYNHGLPVRSDSYRERPSTSVNLLQTPHNLTLSAEDHHHLARLTRVLHLPMGHIVLLSKQPGTGRRSLAQLAAQLTQCALLQLSGKEGTEERHAVIREACWRAGVQGASTALLVEEGTTERTQQELEALIREGIFPGLYSAEQEENVLQTLSRRTDGKKNASKRSLRERYNIQVRNNLHVILLQKIEVRCAQLQRFTFTDVYHPWTFTSLQQVAEELLDHSQTHGSPPSSITRVMSSIHLLAHNYGQWMWPHLPLTSPRAFISFIQTYRKVSSDLQGAIDEEEERLQRAMSRVEQVHEVQEQWTKEVEKCSQHLQEAEQERKRWSRELEETEEEGRRQTLECEELESTKEKVLLHLTRLQSQRQHQLEESHLRWAAVQKDLRIVDIEEIRSYRAPPPPVIMVTDVLCIVFGKDCGWENARLLLGQENFYQDLQFFNGQEMADSIFTSLTRAVRRPEFSVHLVRAVSAAAASLCRWLLGLQHYCSTLRTLEKGSALLSEVEAKDVQLANRMVAQRLLLEKLMILKARSAENLKRAQETSQDLQRDLHQLRTQQAAAQECESKAQPHLTTWSAALETLQRRRQCLQMDALLVAASITYLGCLPWTRCTTLLAKWWSLCHGDEVSMDIDDLREALDSPNQDLSVPNHLLELLGDPSMRMAWQKERLPMNTETLTRAALLQASGFYSALRPTLILDPDLRAERWLQVLRCTGDRRRGKMSPFGVCGDDHGQRRLDMILEPCVIDASDMKLAQRLSSAAEHGLCVLIREVERMPSCLEIVRSLQCRQEGQLHAVLSLKSQDPPSAPVPPDDQASTCLQVFLSTNLPLSSFVKEVGTSLLKEVTVVDLSLGSSGLEEELLQDILLLKHPRLQEERWSLSWNALQLMAELRSTQNRLLDYILSGTGRLVEDEDFLKEMSSCEEVQASLRPSLLDVKALQQRIGEHMTPYMCVAQHCGYLYLRLQEVSRLSPHYNFPASSVLHWAHVALHSPGESGWELEKVLTRGVLTRVLPMIAEEHRPLLHVLLAVGKPHPLEWFSFLGLTYKSISETSSSCIQRPLWVDVRAWEKLAQLEKLSTFQGIRSSLSLQTKQWQEYFALRSTVIGPLPCSSFSHLTLFQAAILWRILRPECLDLVLSHLTTCILGPEPEDSCEEEDAISQSDPQAPVLFLLPQVSPDLPFNYILHIARKRGKEVKILSWSETLPTKTMSDTLLKSQRDGQWILMNWHPRLASLLLAKEDKMTADYRLCVVAEEESLPSVPVALTSGSGSTPCALRLTIRDVVLQSCLDAAEDVGVQNPLTLKLLILHCILLIRQDYGHYIQRRMYYWGHRDLKNVLHAARMVMAQYQDCSEALSFITGAVIYGGHIVEDEDAQSVMAVVQHCLQELDQPGSQGHSHMMAVLLAGGGPGSWMRVVRQLLQKLLLIGDSTALGLTEGLKNTTTKIHGHKILSDLLVTQDIWTSHRRRAGTHEARLQCGSSGHEGSWSRTSCVSSGSPKSAAVGNTLSQCLALLLELEDEQQRADTGDLKGCRPLPGLDTRRIPASMTDIQTASSEWPKQAEKEKPPFATTREQPDGLSKPRPLLRFLLGEWKLLCTLLQSTIKEMREVASSCLCQRCQRIRTVLSEGHVPPWWNVYSPASPITLQAWIQSLHVRLKLLSTYISQSSPFNISYNMSVFRHPKRLLHSLLQEQALEDHRALECYHLQVQVSGRPSPSPRPTGLSLVGIHLRHALWDTRLNLLQATLSPQLCTVPTVHVSAVPETSKAKGPEPALSRYLCPLYTQGDPGGHLQHHGSPLLLLPLPTNVPSCVWSQRCVHALSLL
ncbi:dynein heavy chain domain-containing protein 1 isoform X2 [Eleutherodactylus coqui]|uniref:dynein heavy chain domain-containing protein 1 isoform X2 n=1 Tax=Eleutherodactylus coqui TaxID=57060 RepID=UPI00346218FF